MSSVRKTWMVVAGGCPRYFDVQSNVSVFNSGFCKNLSCTEKKSMKTENARSWTLKVTRNRLDQSIVAYPSAVQSFSTIFYCSVCGMLVDIGDKTAYSTLLIRII